MKPILSTLRAAVAATLALIVLCCGVYPAAVWAIAQLAFPRQANGSLVVDADGAVRGSELIGQGFAARRYFHPRPSAAGSVGYDATASGGSNLGPTSGKLRDLIAERVAEYRRENALPPGEPVPADAVTASASGLDPHISPANARLQSSRVAGERGLPVDRVLALVREHTAAPDLGFLGEPRVNVLRLNRALDALRP